MQNLPTDPAIISPPQADIPGIFLYALQWCLNHLHYFAQFMKSFFGILVVLSFPLSIVFIVGIIVAVERIKRIRRLEHKIFNVPPHVETAVETAVAPDPELSNRWRKVLEHVNSENENDWRLAIIEADILLEEILTKLGYQGEGIGEKLRRVESGDFKTKKQAGEAHGVRNRIAHDGTNFLLSQHEAKRVINLYKQVFEEFFYI